MTTKKVEESQARESNSEHRVERIEDRLKSWAEQCLIQPLPKAVSYGR
jgi:hypothetical protein